MRIDDTQIRTGLNLDDEFESVISEETWKRLLPILERNGEKGLTRSFGTNIPANRDGYSVEETVTIRLISKNTDEDRQQSTVEVLVTIRERNKGMSDLEPVWAAIDALGTESSNRG